MGHKNYVYQCFVFDNRIKQIFYSGKDFERFNKKMAMEERLELALEMFFDKEAFMPALVHKIEDLLGEGNFIYDFWEFGDDDFSLYWFIKKSIYHKKMKLIRQWVKYEELEELVWFEEEDV